MPDKSSVTELHPQPHKVSKKTSSLQPLLRATRDMKKTYLVARPRMRAVEWLRSTEPSCEMAHQASVWALMLNAALKTWYKETYNHWTPHHYLHHTILKTWETYTHIYIYTHTCIHTRTHTLYTIYLICGNKGCSITKRGCGGTTAQQCSYS